MSKKGESEALLVQDDVISIGDKLSDYGKEEARQDSVETAQEVSEVQPSSEQDGSGVEAAEKQDAGLDTENHEDVGEDESLQSEDIQESNTTHSHESQDDGSTGSEATEQSSELSESSAGSAEGQGHKHGDDNHDPEVKPPDIEESGDADLRIPDAPPVTPDPTYPLRSVDVDDVDDIAPPDDPDSLTGTAAIYVNVKHGESEREVRLRFPLNLTARKLKKLLADKLQIPAHLLHMKIDGRQVGEYQRVAELGLEPESTLDVEVEKMQEMMDTFQSQAEKVGKFPGIMIVKVPDEYGYTRQVLVEVEKEVQPKQLFLGGFRDKRTGKIYHHAQTLTGWKPPGGVTRTEQSQTHEVRTISQQTATDRSTQMNLIGAVYIQNTSDRLVTPRPYKTAEQAWDQYLRQVMKAQAVCRGWLARREVKVLMKDRFLKQRLEEEEARRKEELRLQEIRKAMTNPRTKEDFDYLYASLEEWRLHEEQEVERVSHGAVRKAKLSYLLEQQASFLQCIDRRRLAAADENRAIAIKSFFKKSSEPRVLCPYSKEALKTKDLPERTPVETKHTHRAKELMEIHRAINLRYLTPDERLDVLLSLKNTVTEYYCELSLDIIHLIDREADLLMRGFSENCLGGLRQRINGLFLQFCKILQFNPAAAPFRRVPQDPVAKLKDNIFKCQSCGTYLTSSRFNQSLNERALHACATCQVQLNQAVARLDNYKFRAMLDNLRSIEMSYNDDSRAAWFIQDADMRYIVMHIWDSRSIMSKEEDLRELSVARFYRSKPWTPTNCILLTRHEAEQHLKLDDPLQFYGDEMLRAIRLRQSHGYLKFPRLYSTIDHAQRTQDFK